jgi:hypothetical protein
VKDAGFNPVLEYAGDDATYQSDPGAASNPGGGLAKPQQAPAGSNSATEEQIQPLWTAQLRASLTQVYEQCSVPVPSLLQRPPLVQRSLLPETLFAPATNTAGMEAAVKDNNKQQSDSVVQPSVTAAADS